MKLRWLIVGLMLASSGVSAIDPNRLEDPALQARYEALIEELRCLQCQNQTIAASNATLAQDLRRQIRTMLFDGASDDEILTYMAERYGDFVLYRPPLKPRTVALWFGPAVMLLVGLFVVGRVVRSHRNELTNEEP